MLFLLKPLNVLCCYAWYVTRGACEADPRKLSDWRQVRIITSGMGSWRYVDCVSIHGGKLEALEYVRTLFSIPRERCVAAGDSGNDILMLEGAFPHPGIWCRTVCVHALQHGACPLRGRLRLRQCDGRGVLLHAKGPAGTSHSGWQGR